MNPYKNRLIFSENFAAQEQAAYKLRELLLKKGNAMDLIIRYVQAWKKSPRFKEDSEHCILAVSLLVDWIDDENKKHTLNQEKTR